MATLYISYFDNVDLGVAGFPISTEAVTTSSTSAASGNVPVASDVCILFSDAAHYVTISRDGETKPATTTNGFYLPANVQMPLRTFVTTGQVVKITARTVA